MGYDLSGVLFVTGAGGALGRAICLQFAQDGVRRISGLDISESALNETESVLLQGFPDVVFYKLVADLTREEEVQLAIQETVLKFGRIDYAVNNAGIGQPLKPTSETKLADFDTVMAVNVRGVFLCEKYELLQMQEQEPRNSATSGSLAVSPVPNRSPSGGSRARPASKGIIVNVSSILGFLSMPNLSLYNASKHAILGLTRTDALDFATKEIRINAVCPGFIDTPLLTEAGRTALKTSIDKTPMGRLANPEEVADGITFLCSDRASYITGTTLTIDGGYSAA